MAEGNVPPPDEKPDPNNGTSTGEKKKNKWKKFGL